MSYKEEYDIELAKKYVSENNIQELVKLARQCEENEIVQIQLAKLYLDHAKVEQLEALAIQQEWNTKIQLLLANLYAREEKLEKLEELAMQYKLNERIQIVLAKMYAATGNIEKLEQLEKRCKDNKQIQSLLAKMYVDNGQVEKLEELTMQCIGNREVQTSLAKVYMNEENLEKLERLARRYQKNEDVQIQLAKMYVATGKVKELEELANKYKEIKYIQKQVEMMKEDEGQGAFESVKSYIKSGNEEDEGKEEERKEPSTVGKNSLDKTANQSQSERVYSEQDQEKMLTTIGTRIRIGILNTDDIENFKQIYKDMNSAKSYLVLVAMYQKLGQNKTALEILKQFKLIVGNKITKDLRAIEEQLKSKKSLMYPYETWTKILGWKITNEDIEQEMQRDKQEKEQERLKQEDLYNRNRAESMEIKAAVQSNRQTRVSKARTSVSTTAIVNSTNVVSTVNTNKDTIKQQGQKGKEEKVNKTEQKTKTNIIGENLSESLKRTIDKINRSYYVKMQTQEIKPNKKMQDKYERIFKKIRDTDDKKLKKELKELMVQLFKRDYYKILKPEMERQRKYIKKYDKLQSILECHQDNKRAQMELMLVLINEGYQNIAKREFPKEDYQFIDEMIKQYEEKKIQPQEAKQKIDEYAKTTKNEGIGIR